MIAYTDINQFMLAVTTALALYLVSRDDEWQKWGYIVGLFSQPFWFYAAITTMQWGIIVLNLWITYCWLNGIYNHFFKQKEPES